MQKYKKYLAQAKEIKMPKFSGMKMPKLGEVSFLSYTKFSIKKQTFFAKRLSFLIKAGVPMLESIHVIQKQTKSKNEIKIFSKVISDIANGQSLASSLNKFKGVFGNFAINIIKAGESSGTLTQNLNYLADELKKKEMLRKKILSALLYPVIVTLATFGITGVLIVYIFPKILPIFKSLNADLPLSTKIIIFISEAIRNHGLAIFSIIALLVIATMVMKKYIPKVRLFFDGFILRIPLFGEIAKNYNLTNTMRTLGLLLKSGISLNEALAITADTTENMQYKRAFAHISDGVMKGKNISELVGNHPAIFPDMLGHMVSIGEKSGNLSSTLLYLSEFYENEFDDLTKNLSSSIEPVLMIVMGVLVGFVAVSVITPIYEITNSLKR